MFTSMNFWTAGSEWDHGTEDACLKIVMDLMNENERKERRRGRGRYDGEVKPRRSNWVTLGMLLFRWPVFFLWVQIGVHRKILLSRVGNTISRLRKLTKNLLRTTCFATSPVCKTICQIRL